MIWIRRWFRRKRYSKRCPLCNRKFMFVHQCRRLAVAPAIEDKSLKGVKPDA